MNDWLPEIAANYFPIVNALSTASGARPQSTRMRFVFRN